MDLPFTQINQDSGTFFRIFEPDIPESELHWHYDEKNRLIEVLEGNNWKLQLDNELPVTLKEGSQYYIPKHVYHRVHKGTGSLKILIKE